MAKMFQVYGIGQALIPVLPPPLPFENPPTSNQTNYEIGQLVYSPPKAPTVETEDIATGPGAEETGAKANEETGPKTETPAGGGDEYNSYYGLNYQSVPTSNSMTYGNEGIPASLPGGR